MVLEVMSTSVYTDLNTFNFIFNFNFKSMKQFVFPCIILDSSSKAFHFVRPDQCHETCILNRVPPYCKSDIYLYKNTHTHTHTHTHTYIYIQCLRKVAVHLQMVLEVMSTSVYTGLNTFNFILKHFLQICL